MSIPKGWMCFNWLNPRTCAKVAIGIGCAVIAGKVFYEIYKRSIGERSACPTSRSRLIEMDNPLCPVHKAVTIVGNAKISEGMTVLDAGCGPGRVTLAIARNVGDAGTVVALDLQEGMLKIARERTESADLRNITFLQAGLGENRLGRGQFDRVVLVTVLGEIPNQKAALKEIFEALKPNGMLSVTEIIFDPDFLRRSTVIELAKEAGFKEKKRFGNCIQYTLNFEKA